MLPSAFFGLLCALGVLVTAAGLGEDVVGSSRIDQTAETEEITQKEICLVELYKAEEVSQLNYQRETLVKDEFARSVYLTDGYKKDETGEEYYYKSYCYKDFKYSQHKEKTFGDSNAASIVDGGIGRAMKSTNIASNGIDADDGTLKKLSEGESFGNSNLGKNY